MLEMNLPWGLTLLVALFTLSPAASLGLRKNNGKKWDYLTFTQQWPQVACINWQSENPSHQCNITSMVKSWTVHGIWPSSFDDTSPSFCNDSMSFNKSQIQEILPELTVRWPNVYAHTPEEQLWEHEWNKHGTCAAQLPQLQTETLFFKQGIKWSKEIDLLGILKEFGISPSSKTPIMAYDVAKAVEKKLGVTPHVVCLYVPKHKTYYLFELELCFDKSLKLINCPSSSAGSFSQIGAMSCPTAKLVWYPEIERNEVARNNKKWQLTPFQKFFRMYMTLLPYT